MDCNARSRYDAKFNEEQLLLWFWGDISTFRGATKQKFDLGVVLNENVAKSRIFCSFLQL